MPIPFGFNKRGSLLGKLKAAVFRRPIRLEDGLTVFDLETLKIATGNFHNDNKLGEGAFGPVYKGTLTDGKEITVKKFSKYFVLGKENFLNEVTILAKLQHKNLVRIFGCCAEGSERLLVYEHLHNSSLDKLLFDPPLREQLDWEMRFNIILGIARGLVYLHEDSPVRIVHRDVKPSNILLDARLNPKIADFSLARLFVEDESHFSTSVAGTWGYVAPEYAINGQLSVKADVYSFGVSLLEIVCGRKQTDVKLSQENQNLTELVWRTFERGHAVDVIDAKIVEKCGEEEAMRCIHVGLLCTQTDASLRPSISSAYSMLSNPAMTNLPYPIKSMDYIYGGITSSTSSSVAFPSVHTNSSDARESEIIDTEEERQDMPQPLSRTPTSNLTDNEITEIKSYCYDFYMIGEGSFGKVYRGKFRGSDVAIKQIKHTSMDSRTLLENEVRLLHGKDHKNLVGLIAWCIEEEEFYLVYEYVNGCTLQEYLRDKNRCLGWKQCLKIIQDIAEGLEFLHKNQIIHVDIKPQNLMLDRAEEIKIIDFGFSRDVNWEGTHRSTDRVTGTKGYWAPEYCLNRQLSYKHDVYSFGIVALEVITGEKHVDNARASSLFHIPDYVKSLMANSRFEEATQPRIRHGHWNEDNVRSAMAVAEMAVRCADKDKDKRPDMDFVVRSLKSVASENIQALYPTWTAF